MSAIKDLDNMSEKEINYLISEMIEDHIAVYASAIVAKQNYLRFANEQMSLKTKKEMCKFWAEDILHLYHYFIANIEQYLPEEEIDENAKN